MNVKNRWEERVKNAMDYPISSGEIYGDLITTMFGFIFSGMILGTILFLPGLLFEGLVLASIIIAVTIANFYIWIYRTMKSYETTYGSSMLGTDWLKKREEKK